MIPFEVGSAIFVAVFWKGGEEGMGVIDVSYSCSAKKGGRQTDIEN